MNKEGKHFIKDCKGFFPFIGKKENIFLNRLNENLSDYLVENPNMKYEDISQRFGNPKDIMASYIESCDNDYIVHKMNVKKTFKIVSTVITGLIVLSLLIISLFELQTINEIKKQNVIIVEENIE